MRPVQETGLVIGAHDEGPIRVSLEQKRDRALINQVPLVLAQAQLSDLALWCGGPNWRS
jgi:hypothetical protein